MIRVLCIVISALLLSSCSEMASGLLRMSPEGASVSAGHDSYGGLSVNATINFRSKRPQRRDDEPTKQPIRNNQVSPNPTPLRDYEGRSHYTPRQ